MDAIIESLSALSRRHTLLSAYVSSYFTMVFKLDPVEPLKKHSISGILMVAAGLFFLWDRAWLRATGLFAVLCIVITFHAVFNVLVSRPGIISWIGSAVPLAILLAGLILLQGKMDFS